jgi:hypothetical protein
VHREVETLRRRQFLLINKKQDPSMCKRREDTTTG